MHLIDMKWSTALGLFVTMLVTSGQAAFGAPIGDELRSHEGSQTVGAATIPVDPVVEEPLRSLGADTLEHLGDPRVADCGTMNGFTLPVGVLLVSGLGWIPRSRARRRDTDAA